MSNTEFKEWLEANGACGPAIEWAASLDYDPARVYTECHRGDWLLWWAAKREVDRKVLVKAAVECAALALPYTDDERVHHCIDVTRRWCEGLATDEELGVVVRAAGAAWAEWEAARAAAWEDMKKRTAEVVRQYISLDMLVNPK